MATLCCRFNCACARHAAQTHHWWPIGCAGAIRTSAERSAEVCRDPQGRPTAEDRSSRKCERRAETRVAAARNCNCPIKAQGVEVVVLRRLVAKLCLGLVICAMIAGLVVGLTDPTASVSGRAATAGTLNR